MSKSYGRVLARTQNSVPSTVQGVTPNVRGTTQSSSSDISVHVDIEACNLPYVIKCVNVVYNHAQGSDELRVTVSHPGEGVSNNTNVIPNINRSLQQFVDALKNGTQHEDSTNIHSNWSEAIIKVNVSAQGMSGSVQDVSLLYNHNTTCDELSVNVARANELGYERATEMVNVLVDSLMSSLDYSVNGTLGA